MTQPYTELMDTVPLMDSDCYKLRFKAEYWQTKIRYQKLHHMLIQHQAGTLDFEPQCPISLLEQQKGYMGQYLKMLEIRAEIEGINLDA